MQRSQSDDIAWYASHGSGRVIGNLRSNAAVLAYSCTKALPKASQFPGPHWMALRVAEEGTQQQP
jgi:hypothetical protein